jgi:TRAP transporter 4TM/12TM fusion protein
MATDTSAAQPAGTDAPILQVEEEFAGARRVLRSWEAKLFAVFCVTFTLFHLYVLNIYSLEPLLFRAIHVGWGAAIGFMMSAPFRGVGRQGVPWYDWVFVLLSIGCAVYVAVELDGLLFRAGAQFTPGDVTCGVIGTFLILELARRTTGWALPVISGIFILYCFVGPWMPGVLAHKGFAIDRFFTYIYSEYGVFGVTTQVSSSYIILFVTFGAFLTVSKAGDYINDACNALFGWARGGPAKAAVASGVLFGAISGSAVANVVASGMVTIPMMRKVGYDRSTAAAIEATSSTGGQITPPVLGAGAFLMAEITGIPYADIALAAVIPALLFYVACWIHVDLHAVRLGLRGLSRAELPPIGAIAARIYLLSPVFVMIWALMEGYSPFRAGGLGILAALICGWMARVFRDFDASGAVSISDASPMASVGGALLRVFVLAALGAGLGAAAFYGADLVGRNYTVYLTIAVVAVPALLFGWRRTLEALEIAARDSIQLVAVCACAGIIVGVVALTGVGGRFSELILAIAGANHLLAMLAAAMVALILGMGMPTTAAYAIAAAVIAPGLAKIGVPVLVAHMFIFYFAVISSITPPVALASFAAAGLAQADPWKTSWTALKLGLATFLVPFMFYFSPVLLFKGSWPEIVQATLTGAIGVWFLAGATEGWFGGKLAKPLRFVLGGAALCLLHPGSISDLAGLAVGVPIYVWQRTRNRTDTPAPITV